MSNELRALAHKNLPVPQPGQFEMLMADIERAVSEAVGPDGGGWKIFYDRLVITTRQSQNPNLSHNGGDYDYYTIFTPDGLGVAVLETWSCDIGPRSEYGGQNGYFDCVVGTNGLERMAQLAQVTLAARSWLAKEKGSMRQLKAAIRALGA